MSRREDELLERAWRAEDKLKELERELDEMRLKYAREDSIDALVVLFRGRADFMNDEGGCGEAIELRRCADELEAVRRGEAEDAKR